MINLYYYENKINGKMYIGQTDKKTLEARAGKDQIQYKGCKAFYNAIQKYGWNNFIGTIFQVVATQIEADQEEKGKTWKLIDGKRVWMEKSI